MGPRTNGDLIARDVEAEVGAHLADVRKPFADDFAVEVRQIEIDTRMACLFHLRRDGVADFVTRSQLELGRIIPHEAIPGAIAQVGPFSADGLGDQVPRAAGDVQHRGMKLHEFHVAQHGPAAKGDGVSVARGDRRIGRLAKNLPRTTGRQDRLLGPDDRLAVLFIPDDCPATASLVGQQVNDEGPLPELGIRQTAGAAQ